MLFKLNGFMGSRLEILAKLNHLEDSVNVVTLVRLGAECSVSFDRVKKRDAYLVLIDHAEHRMKAHGPGYGEVYSFVYSDSDTAETIRFIAHLPQKDVGFGWLNAAALKCRVTENYNFLKF